MSSSATSVVAVLAATLLALGAAAPGRVLADPTSVRTPALTPIFPTAADQLPVPLLRRVKPIGIEGADDRVAADSSVWPWIAIGRLNREVGGHCTAALIGARQVLTAAHCLYNSHDRRWTLPSELHFVTGYRRGDFAGHGVAVHFVIAPGYDPRHATQPREMARDWAIVELDQPLSIKPIPLSTRSLAEMMGGARAGALNLAGYAADYGEVLMRHQGCQLLGQVADVPLLVHRCDVTYGVSGAPLLLIENGRAEIIGIHNAVAETETGEIATAVPVSAFATRVAAQLSLQ